MINLDAMKHFAAAGHATSASRHRPTSACASRAIHTPRPDGLPWCTHGERFRSTPEHPSNRTWMNVI